MFLVMLALGLAMSVHHFGPDVNIVTTIGRIALKVVIDGPQRMKNIRSRTADYES